MKPFNIDDAKKLIKAWEVLPEGHYGSNEIERWLNEDMHPIIKLFRKKIEKKDRKGKRND